MKIAMVVWKTSSVGGIHTHVNQLRLAGIREGHQVDVLWSSNWKKKEPGLFSTRATVRGGDTTIVIDGEIPQNKEGLSFLNQYDGVVFCSLCPKPRKDYKDPEFQILYDYDGPIVSWIFDGYWDSYREWGSWAASRSNCVLCCQPSYADAAGEDIEAVVSRVPFLPDLGKPVPKTKRPSLLWPNQWKSVKGIDTFIRAVPALSKRFKVSLYSNGIRYYQLRTTDEWKAAVGVDKFQGYHGEGEAVFYGNQPRETIIPQFQSHWVSCNLQGITRTRYSAYKKGSYNCTEVESLYYGCLLVLHETAKLTDLPSSCYRTASDEESVVTASSYAIEETEKQRRRRREEAKEFVRTYHWGYDRWKDIMDHLC